MGASSYAKIAIQDPKAVDMGAFIAMGGIATKGQQGSADIIARRHRRMEGPCDLAEE